VEIKGLTATNAMVRIKASTGRKTSKEKEGGEEDNDVGKELPGGTKRGPPPELVKVWGGGGEGTHTGRKRQAKKNTVSIDNIVGRQCNRRSRVRKILQKLKLFGKKENRKIGLNQDRGTGKNARWVGEKFGGPRNGYTAR